MATSTENFKFKKPDESDFYDVQDQNGNWDIADQELEKLNNPTFEDYTGDTSVPAASAAIEELKSKSKLGVLLSNIKAAFKGACLIGHIVNNCVTDRSDLPLSAAQGKALMDLYNVLNTKGTVYEKYNVADALKGDLVPITTVELPAGNYMIFVSNGVDNSQSGMISCALKASSGKLSSMEMRGVSNNGGGILMCAYFTTTTKSTVTSFGYGYNSGDYKYQSLIIAVKL